MSLKLLSLEKVPKGAASRKAGGTLFCKQTETLCVMRARENNIMIQQRIMKTCGSRRQVWNRTAKYTSGRLTRSDLKMNKRGRIVSRRRSALGKIAFKYIKEYQKTPQEMREMRQCR